MGNVTTSAYQWFLMGCGKEINKIDLAKYKKDSEKGLIVQVDLEYPKELHDHHSDYPLGQKRVTVNENVIRVLPKN